MPSLSGDQSPWSRMSDNDTGEAGINESAGSHGLRSDEVAVAVRPSTDGSNKSRKMVVLDTSTLEKDFRPQMSRVSHASRASRASRMSIDLVSEAMTEVIEGFEPLGAYCRRLIKYHSRLLIGSVVLVAIGVAGGMAIEGWGFLTSLYVIVQISTTIGYGDVTVDREWMRLFMTIYVLLSLLVVANFLNVLLNAVIERHSTAMLESLVKLQVAVKSDLRDARDARRRLGKFNEVAVSGVLFAVAILAGTVFYRIAESCTCSYGVSEIAECDDSSYETCMRTGGHEHTWISAFYMAVITVTTVGFGDYTPKSTAGRIFGIFWMTLGVAATGFFISAVSKVIAKDPDNEIQGAEGIDEVLFQSMDKDGNGYLTKAEYTRFVLVKYGFLSMDVLREIDEKYDSMDLGRRGRVTFEMVQQAADMARAGSDPKANSAR